MLKDIIQMSYLPVVADLTLIFFIVYNSTLGKKRQRTFIISAIICLAMIICNMITYSFEGNTSYTVLMKAAMFVSYSISGPVILPFVFISGAVSKKMMSMLNIMTASNIALSFVSIFTECVFGLDNEGNIVLGSLSPIPFYFSAVYLSVLIYCSIVKFRIGFRSESIFISILCVAIVSAVILNTLFNFKFLVSGMAVLSNTFYYIFYTNQILTRDALTSAFNRHSFYKDIESMNKRQMFVISMDLNGLKQINDTLGHDEGDKAICAVSDSVFALIPSKGKFYRMGGDEFEILCPGLTEKATEALVASLKDSVENKGYSVAVGYKEFTKGMNFEEVLNAADEMMYSDKARMKKVQAAVESLQNTRTSAQLS